MPNLDPILADPAQMADALVAYIARPGDRQADRPDVITCQQEGDLPYVLRGLLRRERILEALWQRLITESITATGHKAAEILERRANAINRELLAIQNAIYKVQQDHGLQSLSIADLKLADAPPPPEATSLDRAQADMTADAILEAEFRPLLDAAADSLPTHLELAPCDAGDPIPHAEETDRATALETGRATDQVTACAAGSETGQATGRMPAPSSKQPNTPPDRVRNWIHPGEHRS